MLFLLDSDVHYRAAGLTILIMYLIFIKAFVSFSFHVIHIRFVYLCRVISTLFFAALSSLSIKTYFFLRSGLRLAAIGIRGVRRITFEALLPNHLSL